MDNSSTNVPEDFKVVEWLTRDSLCIDDKGWIRAKYVVHINGEDHIRWHRLPDIETAIWQHFHILERYFGQYIGLNPQRLRLIGEYGEIRRLTCDVINIARSYLNISPPEPINQDSAEILLQNATKILGRVTNRYKQSFVNRVQGIDFSKDDYTERVDKAANLLPAAGDLAKRHGEILNKSKGIKIRLARLHGKHRACISILFNLYRQLNIVCTRDKKEPLETWCERDILALSRAFNPNKASAIAGLAVVNVQPYMARVKSKELRRLARIPIYLRKRDFDSVRKTIIAALKKMERVIAETDSRFTPKIANLPRITF